MASSRRLHLTATPSVVLTDDWTLWSAEYTRCDASLIRLATVLVGAHDARDLVQEAVFRTVTSKRHADVTNHQAYLVRVVVNTAHQQRRSRGRRIARETQQALSARPVGEPSPQTDVDVRQAVARLSLRQRSVLFLLYWEDRSVDDVANVLQISPGAVSRHAARGRAKLRGVLGE